MRTICVVAGLVMLPISLLRADESAILMTGIRPEAGGVRVQARCSGGFTNSLDLFASTNLAAGGWVILSQDRVGAGTNVVSWLDGGASQCRARFYLVGDAGADGDADGVPDARERLVYRTDPSLPDTDGDGIPDGAEIRRGTDPADGVSGALTLFADSDVGGDDFDGRAGVVGGGHGPKRTLGAAYALAYGRDTISIRGVAVFVEPQLSLGGKSVVLCPQGDVVLRP